MLTEDRLRKWQFGAAFSSPPLPSGLSAGSWVALADPQTDSLSLPNGAAVTGEGTGTNEHWLPLIDSLEFKSQDPLLGLLLGFLCVLGVEVIVAMSQLLRVGQCFKGRLLAGLQEQLRHGEMKSFLAPTSDPACLKRHQSLFVSTTGWGEEGSCVDAGMREWEMDDE